MAGIRFGTDGWRAIIAEAFTFENVRLCAQGPALTVNDRAYVRADQLNLDEVFDLPEASAS